MFEVARKLSATTCEDVRGFLADNVAIEKDVSRYAPGRERGWLQHEGPLSMARSFEPRPCADKLWNWFETVWTKSGMVGLPELGLAAYGSIGIDLHRDATYAAPESLLINFGGVQWAYEPTREVSAPDHYNLDCGEVVRFNCKHRHGALECDPTRWSIVLWSVSHRRRKEFNDYLKGQS